MSTENSPIRPLNDKVIVRPLTSEEQGTSSPSGIIIPDSAKKEKPEQGIIIAVGTGKWDTEKSVRIPMEVKVGDKVVFSQYGGSIVKINGEELLIMSESDILGILA